MAEFRDIVGQEQLKEHLQGAIERNKVSPCLIYPASTAALMASSNRSSALFSLGIHSGVTPQ